MPRNYDSIDLKWNWNGDFEVGKDGDLGDTRDDQIQDLIQQVRIIIASALGDWDEHPARGAGLDDFVGEPNTRDTAEEITRRIEGALITNGVVNEEDLSVRLIPVGPHELFITIGIAAVGTENNSLTSNSILVQLIYDYSEQGVLFINRL